MRDSKVSSMTEDSPMSSPRPFRPPTPVLMQQSTMLTSNSLQQQQQKQQTKKKKKKKGKKKPQPSNLQPAKLPPSLQLPTKVPLPMATSLPMYTLDLPSSTSACVLTGYVHRVHLTKWTSPLRRLPPVRPIASPAVPLRLPQPRPRCLTMGRRLNPLSGAIVASILVLVRCLIPLGPPIFTASSFHTQTIAHPLSPPSYSTTLPSKDLKFSVPLARATQSTSIPSNQLQ